MYIPVKVHGLSKPQISRLLNQHGVKLKIGGSLVVNVSKDQMKKLDRAHKKNGAAVITFDPFQIAQHQHLRGNMKGTGTRIEDQGVSSNDVANFLGAKQSSDPMANKQITMNQVKDAGVRVKNFLGLGMKKRGRPKNGSGVRIEDQKFSVNDVNHFLGKKESSDPIADKPMTLNDIKDAGKRAKKFLGLGVKKRGRPRKLKGGDLWNDIEKAFKPAAIKNTMKPLTKEFRRGKIKRALKPVASSLIHQGIPIVASTLGGIAGNVLGGPFGGMAGGVAGEEAGNVLANYVGSETGYGISKMGVGVGQKKVGRPRKGSALKPAGYGV